MEKAGLTTEGVTAQLVRLNGNMAAVARHFGCTRQSVWGFVQEREELRDLQHDLREGKKDDAEDMLGEAIKRGEAWAVCFFLKCQAKDRGYVERLEQTGANGGPVQLEMVEEIVDVHVRLAPPDAIEEAESTGDRKKTQRLTEMLEGKNIVKALAIIDGKVAPANKRRVDVADTLLAHGNKAHSEFYEACAKAKMPAEIDQLASLHAQMGRDLDTARQRVGCEPSGNCPGR